MTLHQVLIQLTNTENYPFTPDRFPVITHYQIANIKFEVARPLMGHDGFIDIWLAKGYMDNNKYYESQGVDGVHILISDQAEVYELASYIVNGFLSVEVSKKVSQFLVDKQLVDGIVIVNDVEL